MKKMRKITILFVLLLGFLLMMTIPALGTLTLTSPSIADGSTNIYTEVGTFSITLSSTEGPGSIAVNLSLYQDTTYVTSVYRLNQNNGSQSLTLPSLDGNTAYQLRVNVNNTAEWHNNTYNFTTGAKRLTDQTEVFDSGEILLIGIIMTIIVIGFLASFVKDIKDNKKIDHKKLINKLILVVFFVIILLILGSLL